MPPLRAPLLTFALCTMLVWPSPLESRPGTDLTDRGPVGPLPAGWVGIRLADGRLGWARLTDILLPSQEPCGPQKTLALALRLKGAPYRWGGASPDGVDCSGFIQEVFRMAGHPIPRRADEQFQATAPIPDGGPRPGDLVFFTTEAPGPSHVGIYLGEGLFLHASTSRGVTEDRLDNPWFARRFLGTRRLPAWVDDTRAPAPEPTPALMIPPRDPGPRGSTPPPPPP